MTISGIQLIVATRKLRGDLTSLLDQLSTATDTDIFGPERDAAVEHLMQAQALIIALIERLSRMREPTAP